MNTALQISAKQARRGLRLAWSGACASGSASVQKIIPKFFQRFSANNSTKLHAVLRSIHQKARLNDLKAKKQLFTG